jgi:uncharacterized protein (TIGR02284 family)
MGREKETIETLNDLIQINNDRITGYEQAIKELEDEDEDLIILFENMIDESRKARLALGEEVQVLGGTMDSDTTYSGKIYRAWVDVKAVFTGHNRDTVLKNCNNGEDAAQKAYKAALDTDLPAFLKDMIEEQQEKLESSQNEIKVLSKPQVL